MSRKINQFVLALLLFGFAGCSAPLTELSRRGDARGVQRALERGRDVNSRTPQGHSPLTLASREGHLEVVLDLLRSGADVHAVAWSLSTQPRTRAYRNQGSALTRDRFVNADSSGPQSSFMAERTEIDVVWMLKDGRTPLMLAAQRGHLEIVKALVENGADVRLTSGGYWALASKPNRNSFNVPIYPAFPYPEIAVTSLSGFSIIATLWATNSMNRETTSKPMTLPANSPRVRTRITPGGFMTRQTERPRLIWPIRTAIWALSNFSVTPTLRGPYQVQNRSRERSSSVGHSVS